MGKATKETLMKAYRPFDVVKIADGSICFVNEVSINECQDTFDHQVSYSLVTIYGENEKSAWFCHDELEYICNLMELIAENMVHPSGTNRKWVKKLLNKSKTETTNE